MATYQEMAGRSIDDGFDEFHGNNPYVYKRFCAIAMQMIGVGRERYSSKTILCVIRYESDQTQSSDGYKINDAFTSRYARKFIEDHPEHRDFFSLRELRRV